MEDKDYLQIAIGKAEQSLDEGGFPAGAILVLNDMVIGEGTSNGLVMNDPTGHPDIVAIKQACDRLDTTNLEGAVLYTSMQPCMMCFATANWAGISAIVYGCNKSPEMVKKGYYEGIMGLDELNRRNSRKIELDYIPDFENEILTLIKEWEEKNAK